MKQNLLNQAFAPVPLQAVLPECAVLAMGSQLKNSLCIVRDGEALLSAATGDLEDEQVYRDYRAKLDALFVDWVPDRIAIDMHPDYLSSKLGRQLSSSLGVPLVGVQHHHAHIAAVMAEHGLPADAKVLGIAHDGLGFGDDGQFWGGEFLLAGYESSKRLAGFEPVALPGGAMAMREPWRNTFAHLRQALGWEKVLERYGGLPTIKALSQKPLATFETMIERGVNSPEASSCGRLFDAVAALLGIHAEKVAFEGQAAIELEKQAAVAFADEVGRGYPHTVAEGGDRLLLDWALLWRSLLDDLQAGVSVPVMAARFHHGLIDAIASLVLQLAGVHGLQTVACGGGVFFNQLLKAGVRQKLEASGLRVLMPEKLSPGDGVLAFGQAVVASLKEC